MRKFVLGSMLCLTIGTSAAVADPRPSPPQYQLFMRFTVETGSDDLRGVRDNVRATIVFDGVPSQTWMLNQRAMRWADRSTHQTTVPLPRGVKVGQVRTAILRTTFRGGIDGDNWNMNSVVIEITDESRRGYVMMGRGGPKRFTGSDQRLDIPLAPPAAEAPGGKGI